MKKIFLFILLVICFIISGCSYQNIDIERPVSHEEDSLVTVISVYKFKTLNGRGRKVVLTVEDSDLNLEESFTYSVYGGIFQNFPAWFVEEGDVLSATIYSNIMESTGEVTKQYISKINFEEQE